MISNRIVSRGFTNSKKNLIVSRGFTPTLFQRISAISVAFVRRLHGRRPPEQKQRDKHDEFNISVSLVRINNHELARPIEKTLKVIVSSDTSFFVKASRTVRSAVVETLRKIVISAGFKWKL